MNRFNAHLIPPYAKTRNRLRPIRSFSLATTAMWLILGASLACESSGDDASTGSNDDSIPTTTTVPTGGNTSSEGNTTGTTDSSGSEGGETDPPLNMCPPHPNFRCKVAYDCENTSGTNSKTIWVCGALHSPLTTQGCLRSECRTHQDCQSGEKCFSDYRCNPNGCTRNSMTCSDERGGALNGICECSGADDCGSEIGWCVPEAIYDCPLEETTETSTTDSSSSTTMDTTDSSSGGTSGTSETTK